MPNFKHRKISIAILSGAALLMGGLVSCSSQTAESLVAEAKQLQQKGDTKTAIIQLKNALQKSPENADVRYLLGTIYNFSGDAKSAEKELRKARELGMSSAKILPELGAALLAQGEFQPILDETQRIPDGEWTPEILSLRGNAYMGLGKGLEAKAAFDQALRGNPDHPLALVGLARLALATNNVDEATRLTEQAVTKNPQSKEAWLFKANMLRAQGKAEPSLAAYDQVLKLRPGDTLALTSKAFLEIGLEKYEAAKANIETARKTAPNSLMVFYAQALLDFRKNNHAAALESLQQVLRGAPDFMPGVLLAGAVQYSLGSMNQAELHLKKFLEADPSNLYARKMMVSTLLKSRQTQRALEFLEPALKNSQPDAQVLSLAGEAQMQLKNYTKATEYLEKAGALDPGTPGIHTALGLSRLALGEKERAVAELEQAAELDTKTAKSDFLLIMTQLRLREYDKAIASAKKLQKEQPENPLSYSLEGTARIGKRDNAGARASFEKALSVEPMYYPAAASLAQIDLQEKKPDVAKKRFEDILKKDKKNIKAYTALADLATSAGNSKEATTWLERAAQENPDVIQPSLVLATQYMRTGEKQKALNFALKLKGTFPNSPEVLDTLSQIQFANGDKTAALETYKKIAAMRPDSAPVQYRIATLHMAMKNLTAAADSLKKSLSLQPDYLDAQLAMASLESRQGNQTQAMAIAKEIQKKNAKSPVGHELEGNLLMGQNKPDLAAKAFEQAFALGKTGALMVKLHASMTLAGKASEAGGRINDWLKAHPDDFQTRFYLAETLLTSRQNKAAAEHYQFMLGKNPSYVPALNNLAWIYQQDKDPRALDLANKASQLAPENPGVLDTLGWILVEQGDVKRALPILQKAAGLAPQAAEVHYHYAVALIKSGDKTKGRKELEQALSSSSAFPHREEAKALLKQL